MKDKRHKTHYLHIFAYVVFTISISMTFNFSFKCKYGLARFNNSSKIIPYQSSPEVNGVCTVIRRINYW